MALSGKTISLLSKPFTGGDGPSHTAIEMVFSEASADAFLPEEGNKAQRVMGGLKKLAAKAGDPFEPQLRRHFATALMTFAIAKRGWPPLYCWILVSPGVERTPVWTLPVFCPTCDEPRLALQVGVLIAG